MSNETKDNLKVPAIFLMVFVLTFFLTVGLILHVDAWFKILSAKDFYSAYAFFGLVWVVISSVLLPIGAVSGWMFFVGMI